MLALRGRNAAILPSLSANCTSDGLGTRSARAHRANARAGPINPSADLAGRATRLGLEVIAKNSRQDFDQPGCQDGLRLTLTCKLTGVFIIHPCLPSCWSSCTTAGPLRSTGITPLHCYCWPLRHPLAVHRLPGVTGYTVFCSVVFLHGTRRASPVA